MVKYLKEKKFIWSTHLMSLSTSPIVTQNNNIGIIELGKKIAYKYEGVNYLTMSMSNFEGFFSMKHNLIVKHCTYYNFLRDKMY